MTDTHQDIGVAKDDPLFGGDDALVRVTVTDDSDSAVDLATATTVALDVFEDIIGGETALAWVDSDSAMTITGTDSNVAEITLSSTDTSDLAPSSGVAVYPYRVRVTDSDGDTDTVTTGEIAVRPG